MNTKLTFIDPKNWLETLKQEVRDSYLIPNKIEKNVCLELGVNIGAFALINHGKFKHIYGLEASTNNFNSAVENILKNGILRLVLKTPG